MVTASLRPMKSEGSQNIYSQKVYQLESVTLWAVDSSVNGDWCWWNAWGDPKVDSRGINSKLGSSAVE